MKKLIDLVLILGFIFADAIMFHDLFKAGEQYTFIEYFVGALSVLVIINSLWSLFGNAGELHVLKTA
jgi:hypothetical protein